MGLRPSPSGKTFKSIPLRENRIIKKESMVKTSLIFCAELLQKIGYKIRKKSAVEDEG